LPGGVWSAALLVERSETPYVVSYDEGKSKRRRQRKRRVNLVTLLAMILLLP